MHGRIRQQADAVNAEVGEDLAAESDGAEDAAGAGLRAFARAQFLMEDEAGEFSSGATPAMAAPPGSKAAEASGLVVDLKSARGVVQVEDDAATFFRNHAHGLVKDLAAVAVSGKNIAGGATGVDAHQHCVGAGGRSVRLSPGTLAGPS